MPQLVKVGKIEVEGETALPEVSQHDITQSCIALVLFVERAPVRGRMVNRLPIDKWGRPRKLLKRAERPTSTISSSLALRAYRGKVRYTCVIRCYKSSPTTGSVKAIYLVLAMMDT